MNKRRMDMSFRRSGIKGSAVIAVAAALILLVSFALLLFGGFTHVSVVPQAAIQTATPTQTLMPTSIPTSTPTPTSRPTPTPIATVTSTPVPTPTPTLAPTPTIVFTFIPMPTSTPTSRPTPTPTATVTPPPVPTPTPTLAPTPTPTQVPTPTDTSVAMMSGVVKDGVYGSALAGAIITFTNVQHPRPTHVIRSDQNGLFSIQLPLGEYRIVVSMIGYRTIDAQAQLGSGGISTLNYHLFN